MKKVLLILTSLTIVFSTNIALARNVSELEAKTAAVCYMNNLETGYKDVDISDLALIYKIDNPELEIPACYFFNVSDWGWIIMSATTVTSPIVAYNDNGKTLTMSEAPENMMWWLNGYAALISVKQIEDIESPMEEDKMWYELLDNNYSPAKDGAKANVVLLQEEWGQGGNEGNTYNMLCPRHEGVPTITGCVATALSQIIHYYKFPIRGRGKAQYYWCNSKLNMQEPGIWMDLKLDTMFFDYSIMPNFINSSTPVNQRLEVSRLCYAVGVAMSMDYGTVSAGGSGAVTAYVPNVMNAHFKYKRCSHIIRQETGDSTFMEKIRGELMLNRPVYMSGTSQTAVGKDDRHAWVCDGFKPTSTKMYHMNWGWEGSGNGFYNLYDNNAAGMRIIDSYGHSMGYTFILEQTAMIGLVPPHPDSTDIDFSPHTGICDVNNIPQLQSAYPNPATHSVTLPYSIQNTEDMIIYNVEGKIMEQHTLQPADDHIVINVTNMPAGIYTYRVGGATGKFMVQ